MRRSRYTLASDQKLYLLLSASGRKTVVRMIDGRLVRIFVVGDFNKCCVWVEEVEQKTTLTLTFALPLQPGR
jgi:hypothetical protein